MKVDRVVPAPPPATYTLTLSADEKAMLQHIAGFNGTISEAIANNNNQVEVSNYLKTLFNLLSKGNR